MSFSKKINIGNLTVNFEIDESLEWKFKEASKLKGLEKYKSFREILNEHMQYALWFRESIKKLPLLVLRFVNKYPPKILYFKKNRSFIESLKS